MRTRLCRQLEEHKLTYDDLDCKVESFKQTEDDAGVVKININTVITKTSEFS